MAGIPEAETDIPATMSKLARSVLDDTFYNIIHDLVSKVHREEKIARMRSAVVLAKKIGEEETNRLQKQEGALENGSAELSAATPSNLKQKDSNLVRVETDGAIYENGLSGRLTKRNLTPMESGTSAPVPLPTKPSMLKRALPNGDDDTASGSIPKKKKLNTPKKYASMKPTPPSKLKIGTTPDMAAAMEFPDSTPTSAGGGGDVEPASATTTTIVTTSKKKLNPTEGKPGKLKRNDIQRQVKA
ncbi:hypothetical protein HCAG_03203 [Histoplasma mississippiense (nom. inval.)]|uniref:hypothetical protein n=1 Tax=Ajellomyces capsulatus (strain NAm1 / WU24) TaxID=2059318 RepID=UPI000157C0F1|nr:hypothetical protein HCAG_03203 [Histoplasma mississippiense (nom. inval.)]EDN06673.1 hypothetical protein HCAG_03203 [Histoplasma mississippiense (nom. inval.)]